jgi:thioredoxin 1
MSNLVSILGEQFEEQVLKSDLPVIVEFGAVWCGPCKRMEPELEKLALQWKDRIRLVRMDVDEASDLAVRMNVMSVPTVILFVNGEVRQRAMGFQPLDRLVEKFEAYL